MMSRWVAFISIVMATSLHFAAPSPAVDLAKRYPTTLNAPDDSRGYDWTCEKDDVWRLSRFSYALDEKFRIEVGAAQVVFGRHGTNVLWAVLFPDGPPHKIVVAEIGQGEPIRSIWLRFHPARLAELFPGDTVDGRGRPTLPALAKRMAAHKMKACWHSDGRPVVPPKQSIAIDVDTNVGSRRFYAIDTEARRVECRDATPQGMLPRATRLSVPERLRAFDTVWGEFDREYAMFLLKPNVDWARLRAEYRPLAEMADTNYELATVLAEMLGKLEDLHAGAWVNLWGHREQLATCDRPLPLNASLNAVSHLVGPTTEIGDNVVWAKSDEAIGYINVRSLMGHRIPEAFDEALAHMDDTRGLILDLRFNVGGLEPPAKQIAGRFLDRPRLYSLHQFRNGAEHSDLGAKRERVCEPHGPWYYVGPVVVLQGPTTMSSAESFVLMLSQCPQVTTLGNRTAGSSGNPRRVMTGGGITVTLPLWLDMDPDGNAIDGLGIAPDVLVNAPGSAFTDQADPVLSTALDRLRGITGPKPARTGSSLQRRPSPL